MSVRELFNAGGFLTVPCPTSPFLSDERVRGWMCPGCGTYYAPSVRSCNCASSGDCGDCGDYIDERDERD